jgi:tRNA (mo5U34)-methyltransferase
MSMDAATLRRRAEAASWYHTLSLPEGVVTNGWFDARPALDHVPIPLSLAGKRCLDVGTWDGFWAFEMERRGAAEVVAVDLRDQTQWDWPPQARLSRTAEQWSALLEDFRDDAEGFRLAREALGSRVERRELSIYELDPDEIGTFDFVFLGSLLLHLRDPVRALDRLRSVCHGEGVVADTVELISSVLRPFTPTARLEGVQRPWWWMPNRRALLRMLESAGFEVLSATGVYVLRHGPAHPKPPWRELVRRAGDARGREELLSRVVGGIPHVAARVRPKS